MSTVETERFRASLLEERQRVSDAIAYLEKENPRTIQEETEEVSLDNHLADVASVTYDRELDYSLEDNASEVLRAIDGALERIENGTYGVCLNCGKPIAEERLEAMPYVERCIDCKRLEEGA